MIYGKHLVSTWCFTAVNIQQDWEGEKETWNESLPFRKEGTEMFTKTSPFSRTNAKRRAKVEGFIEKFVEASAKKLSSTKIRNQKPIKQVKAQKLSTLKLDRRSENVGPVRAELLFYETHHDKSVISRTAPESRPLNLMRNLFTTRSAFHFCVLFVFHGEESSQLIL